MQKIGPLVRNFHNEDDSVDRCLRECLWLNYLLFSWRNGHYLFPPVPDRSLFPVRLSHTEASLPADIMVFVFF